MHTDDVEKLLGLRLTGDEVASALQRMGHDAEAFDNRILVHGATWRFDLLHPVDWLEDVAIGHGYDRFPGALPRHPAFGRPLPHVQHWNRIGRTMSGLGYREVLTLSLSDPDKQWSLWGSAPEPSIDVRNPVLQDRRTMRSRIIPGLLEVLAQNKHHPLPQRLWEIGDCVPGSGHNEPHLGVVQIDSKAGFARIRAVADAVVKSAGWSVVFEAANAPGFVAGRQMHIVRDGVNVGHFGELHPDTIVAFQLHGATIALELKLGVERRARRLCADAPGAKCMPERGG